MTAAFADAMRKHDPIRLTALRMLKTALTNREVERGRALDDAESQNVVAALVKQRRDSIEQFTNGGRRDLADKEAAEIRVLEAYLPQRLSAEQIAREIAALVAELGAAGPADMGKVMAAAKTRLAGKADMGLVSSSVKQALAR